MWRLNRFYFDGSADDGDDDDDDDSGGSGGGGGNGTRHSRRLFTVWSVSQSVAYSGFSNSNFKGVEYNFDFIL
uniref:Uncharacterized protein n=1 Tax=Bracon brevicornis TaxID=1563983 RepID=A0A6V7KJC2_9HYME